MKTAIAFLILCLSLVTKPLAAAPTTRVLMLVPDDFMWPEFYVPQQLYAKAGFVVTVAGRFPEDVRPDRRNAKDFPASHPLHVDVTFDKVKVEDYDAVTCVAGNGAWHDFFPNETVHKIIKQALERKILVGLLCASTGLLGFIDNPSGDAKPIAEGKTVVGYFRVAGILKHLGHVKLIDGGRTEPGIAVDGNLVTGRNPESSELFGRKVVEILSRRK
jgi:putative intracellular protease/amidase